MSDISLGDAVPEFAAVATGGEVRLSDLRGHPVVLFFFPKADTPGCTREGQDFRDLYPQFQARDVAVIGVSRDGLPAQQRFKARHEFPFELIADTDERLCRLFDVIKQKNLYGKQVIGIERSTFLLDGAGVLQREWRRVKVAGHADEVLGAARAL